MAQKFFKNQARQIKKPQEHYVPEYVRLPNKTPIVQEYDRHVFRHQTEPVIPAATRGAVPKQVHISSGANQEHEWTQGTFDVPKKNILNDCPNCGYPNVINGENYKGIYTPGAPCRHCGIVENAKSERVWTEKPAREMPTRDTNNVAPGNYIIMHESKILFIGNESEAEDFVWEMAAGLNGEEPVDISEIMVLKRLPIKVGASFVK